MSEASSALVGIQLFALLVGVTFAAVWDARTREVPAPLWQIFGVVGAVLGAILLVSVGVAAVLLWALVSGFALQHLFPWDERWADASTRLPDLIEMGLYVGVGLILVGVAIAFGPATVPLEVLAVYLSVLIARGLYETGILYGGADAKVVMVCAVLLPIWATPVVGPTPALSSILQVEPFAVTALVDAAVLTLAVPIALAIHNARRREFSLRRGFVSWSMATTELPNHFVWLYEPKLEDVDIPLEVHTAAEDRQLRRAQSAALRARGIERVWVSPQIPLIVFFALGAVLALLLGNLIFDIVAIL